MRKFMMLVIALGLVAAGCGGDSGSGGSCDAVADDAIALIQDLINEVDQMTLEEAAALGEDNEVFSDMEQKADDLQAQADDLGCSDAEMEELFLARIDNLTAEGLLGEAMLEGFRSESIFE